MLFGGGILIGSMLILLAIAYVAPSDFGNYIAGIAGLLNVFAFIGLTVIIHINETEQAEKSMQFRAEELIIKKIQSQQEKFNELYLRFLSDESENVADETFELLQPLMTYFYYLGHVHFLTKSTQDTIEDIRQYFFTASDYMYTYALGLEDNKSNLKIEVFRAYREIYRKLGELEVIMLADVAKVPDYGVEITNYKEKHEKMNN